MIEIKCANKEDVAYFFGEAGLSLSMRAWSIYKDNVLACLYGYLIRKNGNLVFCDIKDSHGKVEVARTAKKAFKLMAEDKKILIAIQDKEICNSERFLNFLGFKRSEDSDMFVYTVKK